MHVCLVIDLLTAIFLIHGLINSKTRLRKQLCMVSLIYLVFISVRTYLIFASYFGFFQRYPSLTTRSLDFLLRFFRRVLDAVRCDGAGEGRILDRACVHHLCGGAVGN